MSAAASKAALPLSGRRACGPARAQRECAPVTATATATEPVASPCTGVCRIDRASGCCCGCLRTLDEIAAWPTLEDRGRRALLSQLADRRRPLAPAARR